MKLLLPLSLTALTLLFSSCDGMKNLPANGGRVYGETFRFISNEKITNLFSVSCFDTYTSRVISQIYDPLLKLDFETMKVMPSIATSYQVSDDEKKYILTIRKGVRFHDDPCFEGGKGRLLTARDIKYSLELACSGLAFNRAGYLLIDKIVGAQEFYDKSSKSLPSFGVSGIKIIDDYTIEINLIKPNFEFDKLLTLPSLSPFPREAFEKYNEKSGNHPVGTGPFMLSSMDNNGIKLKRNNHYWVKDEFGNQLPFLDGIDISYIDNKRDELIAFRQKKIDLVLNIPVEEVDNVLGPLKDAQNGKYVNHKILSLSGLDVHYIGFACEYKVFKDINVRKAFNYAINRERIIDDYLLGDGILLNGVVPSGKMYPAHKKILGYEFDVKKAQELLAKAGYPNGKNFPVLEMYVNPLDIWKGRKMCASIAEQLKQNLNVKLKITLCSLAKRSSAIKSGKAKIWKSGWNADYPSAENFLNLFYSGKNKEVSSQINEFNFRSEKFDRMYEKALHEENESKRAELFALCDQIVVDEAAVIPIISKDYTIMINTRVKGFKQSSIEAINFSSVYIKDQK